MNINMLIQLALLGAIGLAAYLVVDQVQNPPTQAFQVAERVKRIEMETSKTITAQVLTPAALANLKEADVFIPMIARLTPTPTRVPPKKKVIPPMQVSRLTAAQKWQVVVTKKLVIVKRFKQKNTFMRVGDTLVVKYANKEYDVKLVESDPKKRTATFEHAGSRQVLSMFK